ncbi:hypothetical protein [Streptomyces griseus]|uniref:hypothetical protein n=1 Tax=Streptomyces griseus TaxID=1911 RepID=UPI0033E02622
MSYVRWGEQGSDVYVFWHVEGWIECCGCSLREDGFQAASADEMEQHLKEHRSVGDCVPDNVMPEIRADEKARVNYPTFSEEA